MTEGAERANERIAEFKREAKRRSSAAKGKQCEAITLVGYRRCRRPATWTHVHAGRDRFVCTAHFDTNLFFDSPEYLSSPGYAAKVRTSQTRPGTMTFTTVRKF